MRGNLPAIVAALLFALASIAQVHAGVKIVTYEGAWGDTVARVAGSVPVPGGASVLRYDGSLASTALSEADVLDAGTGAATHACDEGPALPVPPEWHAPTSGNAALGGIADDCGTGYLVTSLIVASVPGGAPDWPAFLGNSGHGGGRGLPYGPRGTLELALMAQGVAPGDVYSRLATREGEDMAYAALDAMAATHDLFFWKRPQEAIVWLIDGRVTAAAVPSPHAARAVIEGAPLSLGFDGQIYRIQRLVLLATHPARQEAALAVMAHFLTRETQAILAGSLLAGPVSNPAFDLIPQATAQLLPTARLHKVATRGLATSHDFWTRHGSRLAERHSRWLGRVEARAQAR